MEVQKEMERQMDLAIGHAQELKASIDLLVIQYKIKKAKLISDLNAIHLATYHK
jgi:hypothetical protein